MPVTKISVTGIFWIVEPTTYSLTAMCFNIFVMDEESAVQIARRLVF